MRTFCFLFACLLCTGLYGHRFNEVNYTINQVADEWQLSIHFTPETALQLVDYLDPKMKGQAVVQLSDYYESFAQYFDQTISINLDDHQTALSFTSANFEQHNAYMTFKLQGAPSSFQDYTIRVKSFVNLFTSPINYLTVINGSQTSNCSLNKMTTSCSTVAYQSTNGQALDWLIIGSGVVLLILLLSGAYLLIQSGKVQLKNSNSTIPIYSVHSTRE